MNEHEQRLIASISRSMALMCVRNTMLEDIHVGIEPVSRTGDFTDVIVIDANGRESPWTQVSRIGDEEMGRLIRQVVNRLFAFQAKADNLHFVAMMDPALAEAWRLDEPELDETILSTITSSSGPADEGKWKCRSRLPKRTSRQAPPTNRSLVSILGITQTATGLASVGPVSQHDGRPIRQHLLAYMAFRNRSPSRQ